MPLDDESTTDESTTTMQMLQECRHGGEKSWHRLLERHRDELVRFVALRMPASLRSRIDPSDVVQDTQLVAFRRLDDFLTRNPMPFRVWLLRTAREQLISMYRRHLRARHRSVAVEVPLADESSILIAQNIVSRVSSPSEHAMAEERRRQIQDAIGRLTHGDRELLLMRQYEKRSYEEIAEMLGIQAAAVRQRHARALMRLRATLLRAGLI
jgi:RNA polymerase sigma-70 factor (ECF subfamily)